MKNSLALFVVSSAIGLPAWSAPTAQVELRPQALVTTDAVALGQVAHVRSTSLELARFLVNLRIGPAPRLGGSASVSRQALDRWIRRQAGADTAGVEWTGDVESATVMRASQHVAGQRIADAAMTGLRDRLAAQGQSAQIALRSAPAGIEVEPGELRLQVRDIAASQLRPHLLVWVEIQVDGRTARSVPVSLALAADDFALAARSNERPMTEHPRGAAGPYDRPSVRAVVVQRGESAALRETSGAIALESRVEVLQDGGVGDKVRVRAAHATGLMLARVVGPGLLEIAP